MKKMELISQRTNRINIKYDTKHVFKQKHRIHKINNEKNG